ncbi:MAG TPA: nucleotidyl transferase AbiEii/AbiGii toxin family protein, partial [Clostridia bacterium]|nr:nucleotidyl transferase AbiEii/AbiGii toxin family protein [Clostridia bacterium]
YVLLDILFDKNSYTEIQETYIQCNLIDTVEPILKVKTPSINCILGDKLTAFAPNTTGIIYGQKKELEIIKQLYDISCLFDLSSDIDTVRETFIRTVNKQIEYRSLSITYNDVLKDIFKTSLILASRGSIESDMFKELENGVKKMRGYVLTNRSFIIEEAIECSAKAAYLSMLLTSPLDKIEKFDNSIDLSKVRVKNRIINSIKKFSPEGFFYWFKAIELCETYEQSKRTYEFTIPSKGISL